MPPKRNRPLTTQEAGRMERARRQKELAPSIRESPHIEAQSLLSLMEKGNFNQARAHPGTGTNSSSSSSSFCLYVFFFFFLLLYNSLRWNKMFQSRRSHDGFAGCDSLPKNGGSDPEPVGHISPA
jgi:hypothetical protein